jgi:hypothetical protein
VPSSIAFRQESGDRMLRFDEHRVLCDQATAGPENRVRQFQEVEGLAVIQVMDNSMGDHDVELLVSQKGWRHFRLKERASVAPSSLGGFDVSSTQVEADITDVRRHVGEIISRTTSDVEDAVQRLGADVFVDKGLTTRPWSQGVLDGLVEARGAQETPGIDSIQPA